MPPSNSTYDHREESRFSSDGSHWGTVADETVVSLFIVGLHSLTRSLAHSLTLTPSVPPSDIDWTVQQAAHPAQSLTPISLGYCCDESSEPRRGLTSEDGVCAAVEHPDLMTQHQRIEGTQQHRLFSMGTMTIGPPIRRACHTARAGWHMAEKNTRRRHGTYAVEVAIVPGTADRAAGSPASRRSRSPRAGS